MLRAFRVIPEAGGVRQDQLVVTFGPGVGAEWHLTSGADLWGTAKVGTMLALGSRCTW